MINLKKALDYFSSYGDVLVSGRVYASHLEEDKRKGIFKYNVDIINKHNQNFIKGHKSFYLGVNAFTDQTLQEFLATSSGSNVSPAPRRSITIHQIQSIPLIYPDAIDWRKKGFTTPVRDQGMCASDWAMSTMICFDYLRRQETAEIFQGLKALRSLRVINKEYQTGVIEGQLVRYFNKTDILSVQQLMDCSAAYHNYGCSGGLPTNAYQYIYAVNGIESEEDYPYEKKKGKCRFNKHLVKADVYGWAAVKSGDEATLQQAIAMDGPMSVLIDSSHLSFQLYSGGIYDEPSCSNTTLCHAVLVVGYNTNPDYWIVKNRYSWYVYLGKNKSSITGLNYGFLFSGVQDSLLPFDDSSLYLSWGASWGENGYIRMSRNKGNQCGIATNATYPIL